MLPHLTSSGKHKRQGLDDGYHGRPRNPQSRYEPLLDAYMAGYRYGQTQRQQEIKDGTHSSLFHKGDPNANRRSA